MTAIVRPISGQHYRKVAIVGSRPPDPKRVSERDWQSYWALVERARAHVRALPPGTILVSGGARGIDLEAEREAKRCGLNVEIHYPRWREDGRAAGYMRNLDIVRASDRVSAFWYARTRGTRHTITCAVDMGKPLLVHDERGWMNDDQLVSSLLLD
jgi:hypothetical protein